MDLILDKLGRIEHAEIPIRPLTVFVGENNTNKTWAAYCLYGLARQQARNPDITTGFAPDDTPLARLDDRVAESVDRVMQQAREAIAHSAEESVTTLELRRASVLDGISHVDFHMDAAALGPVIGVPARALPGAEAHLILSRAEVESDDVEALVLTINKKRRTIDVAWRGTNGRTLASDSLTVMGQADSALLADDVERFVRRRILQTHRTVLALPAERKLIASIFSRQRLQDLQKLSLPVRHYNDFLAIAGYALEEPMAGAPWLESLLGGRVAFENGTTSGLIFRFGPSGELPIQGAASLVRALAGLDLYCHRWARAGDLLIIDEPEMNAHPAAQIRITELLACLVNKGIRVVLTTHSPYVIGHIDTLVEASRLEGDARAEIVKKLGFGDELALLAPEQLAVYRFGLDGAVTSIFDPEERAIDPAIFSDVGDAETNLLSQVLSAERRHREQTNHGD